MSPNDPEPTPEESEEAEKLARALDRGHAPSPPGDALGAAALLRYAKDEGALDPARGEAILEDVLSRAKPPRRAKPLRWFLLGSLGLSAAAGAALFVMTREPKFGPSELPAPPRALLDAEIRVSSPEAASLDPLGAELGPYRVAVYSAMKEHYGR